MAVGRNDVCPCGSGQKFKRCCEGKASRSLSKGLIILIVAIAAVAAIGLVPMFLSAGNSDNAAVTPASRPAAARNTPQPGPAPPGKVWSPEHNHWHDAPTRATMPLQVPGGTPAQSAPPGMTPQAQQFTPGPQPPGPAPAGKVWSTEHGHWHDAPAQ